MHTVVSRRVQDFVQAYLGVHSGTPPVMSPLGPDKHHLNGKVTILARLLNILECCIGEFLGFLPLEYLDIYIRFWCISIIFYFSTEAEHDRIVWFEMSATV